MGMAEKIIANAASFLEPGEQVHGAFAGQKTLTNRLGEGGYSNVVATDRRFLVFQSGSFSQTSIKRLLTTAPRGQRLGAGSGLWHEVTLDGLTMKVNRRYFTQLQAIDQAVSHA
jgi:hypothetical protein